MSKFKYFRNKRTGRMMRAVALPYMGQNSNFEVVTEEEFRHGAPAKAEKAAKPDTPPTETALPDNDDLTAGLDYGEDGR